MLYEVITIVRLLEIDGQEFLFYKGFPIQVALLRGTTADPDGNVSFEKEALTTEAQAIAMATHNSGGIVIVQVERLAERGTLDPKLVKLPSILRITSYNVCYTKLLRIPHNVSPA